MAQRSQAEAGKEVWSIDPAHSVVEFSVKHMMITSVRGQFRDVFGTIAVDEENPDRSSVEVTIDAASIDTRVEQRDAHLRSPDFLDVEKYPTITFKSRRVEGAHATEGDRFKLVGDLTIRDTTREVALEATFQGRMKDPWGGERAGFTATTTIDRREFGLTWQQVLEVGGLLVGNDIRIDLDIQAVKMEQAQREAA